MPFKVRQPQRPRRYTKDLIHKIILCHKPNSKLETRNLKLIYASWRKILSRAPCLAEPALLNVSIREGDEFSTVVRLGQVETLKESGSKAIGMRVFYGKRAASTYSSDFSRAGLDRMVKSALELARITSEDPFGGIPEASQLGSAYRRPRSVLRRRLFAAGRRSHQLRASAPRRLRSTTILASRTRKAVRSKPQPDTKFWRIRTASSANTSVPIVRSPQCPSRSRMTAASNATIGFRSPAA